MYLKFYKLQKLLSGYLHDYGLSYNEFVAYMGTEGIWGDFVASSCQKS